jgi:DNA-binding transcriptional LysR family regulator
MLDIHRLKIFVKIADLKSFTLAAEACFLTQPTVSQHITALEQFLGLQLFNRGGRELSLTGAGEILYHHASRITRELDELTQALEQYKGKKIGHLFIGASTIPGECILPGILKDFRTAYPDAAIRLRIADTQTVLQMVLDHHVDVGMVGTKVKNERLKYTPLIKDELVLIVPPDHRWAHSPCIALKDLAGETFVMRESGSGTRTEMGKAMKRAGLDPRSLHVAVEVDSNVGVKESVAAGLGISFVSKWSIENDIQTGRIKTVHIRDLVFKRWFFLVRDTARAPSPLCAAFKKFLTDSFKQRP